MKTEPQSDLSSKFKFLPGNAMSQSSATSHGGYRHGGCPSRNHGKGRISLGATKQDGNWPLNTQAGKMNPRAHGSAGEM